MSMTTEAGSASSHERRLEAARAFIGAPRNAPPTPALILDLPKVRRNLSEMAERMQSLPAALRPHAKIHKSPILGRMQIEFGAIGLTTATVWEAAAMVDAGLSDILVANQVVGPVKAAELARIAGEARVIVTVDSEANAAELGAAASAAGSRIDVLLESDVGLHRAGVRTQEHALSLARAIQSQDGLRLVGLFGYEGHCMLEPDRATRVQKARTAIAQLLELVDEFERRELPTEIVAAGGFGTWDITGANPRVTEIHAGSYIFMDAFHRNLVPGFDVALTVLATVVSRSGTMAVIDCGRKSIGIDRIVPELVGSPGEIRYEHGEHFVHEEHTALVLDDDAELEVGSTVELMPGYSPTTVNLYDMYYVAESDAIVDVWPICARYGSDTAGLGPR
jgi:D-serine deaminase-like pyridoxal phosphate-dependent protein